MTGITRSKEFVVSSIITVIEYVSLVYPTIMDVPAITM